MVLGGEDVLGICLGTKGGSPLGVWLCKSPKQLPVYILPDAHHTQGPHCTDAGLGGLPQDSELVMLEPGLKSRGSVLRTHSPDSPALGTGRRHGAPQVRGHCSAPGTEAARLQDTGPGGSCPPSPCRHSQLVLLVLLLDLFEDVDF